MTAKKEAAGRASRKIPVREKETRKQDAMLRARDEKTRENALNRPPGEWVLRERKDRVGSFLKKHLEQFSFDEFSDEYLKAAKTGEILRGVPVPLREADLSDMNSGNEIPVAIIGENMVWVIGIDPKFKHTDAYVEFILKFVGKKAGELLVNVAQIAAEREAWDEACIHYRAALVLKPDDENAMYGYARICRAMYNSSTDISYIGSFKAEALDYLELLTELYPKFAEGWYHLGFMYLNMGLYTKAHLVWETFLSIAKDKEARREIMQRMRQLRTPMEIERGTNHVLSGRWLDGIAILESFSESAYKDWWPLWYYLGEAYENTNRVDDATEAYKQVLGIDASNTVTMERLISIYEADGKVEMVKKYTDKIALIRESRA
ncbi:MAG: hypothetical protein LBN36_02470 [Clostridiales Family XIII bacterium]|jgi:tetratricopeptide (TPR) repeat protein|nr:hypothetical protein [Clostridiales Family XIII bacterium]